MRPKVNTVLLPPGSAERCCADGAQIAFPAVAQELFVCVYRIHPACRASFCPFYVTSQTSALETKLWQFPVVAETERFNNCATTSSDCTWLDTVCIRIRVSKLSWRVSYTLRMMAEWYYLWKKKKKKRFNSLKHANSPLPPSPCCSTASTADPCIIVIVMATRNQQRGGERRGCS